MLCGALSCQDEVPDAESELQTSHVCNSACAKSKASSAKLRYGSKGERAVSGLPAQIEGIRFNWALLRLPTYHSSYSENGSPDSMSRSVLSPWHVMTMIVMRLVLFAVLARQVRCVTRTSKTLCATLPRSVPGGTAPSHWMSGKERGLPSFCYAQHGFVVECERKTTKVPLHLPYLSAGYVHPHGHHGPVSFLGLGRQRLLRREGRLFPVSCFPPAR